MKTCKLIVGLLAVVMVLTSCAQMGLTGKGTAVGPVMSSIQSKKALVVGTSGSMPPMNMTTKKGEVVGLEIDLARAMAKAMGVELQIKTMAFSKLLPALEAGHVDMVLSSMTITPERNQKVAFVGPYFISGKGLLTKIETLASAKEPAAINTPATRLAALEGSTSEQFITDVIPKATLITAKTHDDAVQMVIQGQVDALIADFQFCAVSVLRNPDAGLLSIVTPLTYEPIGIALPPGDAHMVNWVTNFLNTTETSGDLARLKLYWFGSGAWLDDLPSRMFAPAT
jgi:polar amino acid transport system substrate-binding protein